jgi:hypothetical protein
MNRRELLGSVGAASLLPAAFVAPARNQPLPVFQASMRLGPMQNGPGNHRWAEIVAGSLSGTRVSGRVESGRMDWMVDPCSGSVEIAIACSVRRPDGKLIQLRDRTASAAAGDGAALPGHPTSPVISESSGEPGLSQLVGRLDTTAFWRGFVSLRAFATA